MVDCWDSCSVGFFYYKILILFKKEERGFFYRSKLKTTNDFKNIFREAVLRINKNILFNSLVFFFVFIFEFQLIRRQSDFYVCVLFCVCNLIQHFPANLFRRTYISYDIEICITSFEDESYFDMFVCVDFIFFP